MTSTTTRRHRVIDMEDTVTLHLPDDATQNMPPYRDGIRPPRRPTATGEHPTVTARPAEPDELQERFNRFYTATGYAARHRWTWRTELAARVRRLIGGAW